MAADREALRSREEHVVSAIGPVISQHSVLIYFVLVFVIAWGGGFLILGPEGLPRTNSRPFGAL
jgi:hypothetical protein